MKKSETKKVGIDVVLEILEGERRMYIHTKECAFERSGGQHCTCSTSDRIGTIDRLIRIFAKQTKVPRKPPKRK